MSACPHCGYDAELERFTAPDTSLNVEEMARLQKQLEDAEDKLGACACSVQIWQDMQEQSAKSAKLWKRLAKRMHEQLQAERELAAELELEREEARAELLKYEPSDGMMYRLLELHECIREAARLLGNVNQGSNWYAERDVWLQSPTVQRAVKR